MKVIIEGLNKDIPAVTALLMRPHNMSIHDGEYNSGNTIVRHVAIEDIDIEVNCNGIIVNDDRISIEFSDGDIADYEIHADDYRYIKIL